MRSIRPSMLSISLLVLAAACGAAASGGSDTTSCEEIDPECTAERLPDVILRGDETRGALGAVDGLSLDGIISFDEALRRAIVEGGRYGSDTVQVTLGSAHATQNHWGEGVRLFYDIEWRGGICGIPYSGGRPGGPISSTCFPIYAGTIIDAETGDFIVSGENAAS